MREQVALTLVSLALAGCTAIVDRFSFESPTEDAGTVTDGGHDGGRIDAGERDGGLDGAGLRDAGMIPPPRLIAPLSTSRATSRRPSFQVEFNPEIDGAQIELCEDRACSVVVETLHTTEASARPPSDLPPGVVFWRAFGSSGATTGEAPSPVWQVYIGPRNADGDVDLASGTTLDLNGDGHAEVAIGAPQANTAEGVVHVHLGGPGGVSATPLALGGPVPGGHYGTDVASAGDLNGDGFSELVVGAPTYNDTSPARVYVYGGGGGALTTPPQELSSPEAGYFGWSAQAAGDVNGDGYGDLIVGDWSASQPSGAAYLYTGSAGGLDPSPVTLTSPLAREFGRSLAGAGDLNGDGYADVAVGAPGTSTEDGAVYVYLGGASGLGTTPISLAGPPEGRRFGESVSVAGDVNGDGYSDLIVGAMNFDGAAYLYLGGISGPSPTPIQLRGPAGIFGNFGWSVAHTGDIDGDGFSDLAIGGPRANDDRGATLIYLGGPSGPTESMTSPLDGPMGMRGRYGTAVAGAGDVNLDGFDDLVVGASGVRSADGTAFVYLGSAAGADSAPSELRGPLGLRGSFGESVAGSN